MAKVLNGVETYFAENFNRLSRAHAHQHYRRQTDKRQTDGRRYIANVSEALISEKPLSGKLRGPYMWKALIPDKGSKPLSQIRALQSVFEPEDGEKQSTEVGTSAFNRLKYF